MKFWTSLPNPVWVAVWLFFFPPVNLINFIRLLGYTRTTKAAERDPNYSPVWMLIILSAVMTVVVIITIVGLYLLIQSNDNLIPPQLAPDSFGIS